MRGVYEDCQVSNKFENVNKADIIEKTGVAFLLASNCCKDVGIMLLLGDTIVQDPKNWQNDVIVLIFLGLFGRQAYADCEQFIHYIHH